MSAHGAHAEPNKILAALATEPSAIKQYAQRTDQDIHLRNAAFLERGVTSRWYQQSHSARLYSSVFQFKHCTRVPARKQNNVACCFIEQTKCARLKTSAFQPLTQYLNDVVWRSKLIHIHIQWLQNKPGFYSLDERFPMK